MLLSRYLTYKAIKNHFFMLDFCYFVNVSHSFLEHELINK